MRFMNSKVFPAELSPYIKKLERSKTALSILLSAFELIEQIEKLPKEQREAIEQEMEKVPQGMIF